MKKIPILLSILMLLISLSCSFEPFKEVRIIGDPQIVIPLGARSSLIGEQFDIEEELRTNIAGQDGLSLIESASPSDPLTLEFRKDMVNMGLDNIPLDDLGLDSLNQTIDPTTMNVPDLNIPAQSSTAGLDNIPLPTVTVSTISLPTLPESNASATIPVPTQNVTVTGFTTITYSAGTMIMSISSTPATASFEVTVDAVITTAGNTLTTSGPVTITGTGSADLTFPLTGRSMGNTMDVDFTITGVNGTLGQTFALDMATNFSADAALSSASGVDFNTTQTGSINIPFDLSDPTLISLVIGSGNVALAGPTMPGTWSGVSSTVDLDMQVNGVSRATGTGSLDLAGVPLANGDTVSLDYTVNVIGTNAIVSVTPGVDEFSFTATPAVTEFQEIVLDATDMDFSINESVPLDASITDLVSSVTFDNPGLAVNLDNQLPNDITVTIDSADLELTSVSHLFASSTADSLNSSILATSTGTLATPAGAVIDIALDIAMTGYDDTVTPPTLTLNSMTPGNSYSLSGSIELYSTSPGTPLQLVEAVVRTTSVTEQFPASGDPGIDFASTMSGLDDVLPPSAEFSGIEAFLDVDVSALTDNGGSIDIYLSIDYTIGGVTTTGADLLGTSGTPVTLSGTQRVPFTDPDLFTTLINGRASDIFVHYDVTANGATVDLTGTSQNITVSAVAEIPIQLTFTSDYDLEDNGEPFIPTATEDLFGRDGTTNDDDINEWLGMATDAAIHLELQNSLLQTTHVDGTLFTFTLADTGGSGFSKTFTINGTSVDIALDSTDIATMTDPLNYPFLPSYTLTLPAATYTVTSGDIDLLSSYISVQSDIDYTIEVGGAQ